MTSNGGEVDALNRRELIAGAAVAGALGAAGLAACARGGGREAGPDVTDVPAESDGRDAPFDTVVVLMMENRSFDHLLGWLPGADGIQEGLEYVDVDGEVHQTWEIVDDPQGCDYADPGHTWQHMATHFADGRMDGFLETAKPGDLFPISYYNREPIPCLSSLAENFTTFDNYFCSFLGPTWPNRLYQHCATTDLTATMLPPGEMGTATIPGPDVERPSKLDLAIWDRLADADVSARYYYHVEPITALFESRRYDDISFTFDRFLADAAAGTLPNVCFVDPDFGIKNELNGMSNDMHPHGSVTVGDALIGEIYEALSTSPQWDRMVFVINFDESGGFYDHVVPPQVDDDTFERMGFTDEDRVSQPVFGQLGPRVPAIAVSPFAPAKVETAGPYDHCSVLRMIEWRWGLEPMTVRDANAKNLADALDFSSRRDAIVLPPYTKPDPTPCEGIQIR